MNILLVWPSDPPTFWSFSHVLPFVAKKSAYPPLGLLTVAAMLPKSWNQRLVDLNVRSLRDADLDWADYVFISAMIIHADSAKQIVARCIARNKPVIAGGPLFTTGHERFPEIKHFVLGEAEDLMAGVAADMVRGDVKPHYRSAVRPDVTNTPIPRWDLLQKSQYVTMPLQFSRGCPFNCEFCDIIVMNGRIPRVKTPQQMIGELEALLATGWDESVFIVDDNFIGNKVKVKAFLRELVSWRRNRKVSLPFTTEASLNLADDAELLDLMVQAGFKKVFVGIESPSHESLTECAKVQNSSRDMAASVRLIHKAGIEVMGGFIVGFDSDGPSIFERQRRFIEETGIVTAMVGLLTALPETRLFHRLREEGRLLAHSTGNNLDAVLNFIPKLDRETLIEGYRDLVKRIYTPREYYQRVLTFLRDYRPSGPKVRLTQSDLRAFFQSLWTLGIRTRGRMEFWKFTTRALVSHPRAFSEAMAMAITGYHFRQVAGTI
ncbi:MAG: B12-binding domain-containing radical SAM protein [Planctomycetota bacterium]